MQQSTTVDRPKRNSQQIPGQNEAKKGGWGTFFMLNLSHQGFHLDDSNMSDAVPAPDSRLGRPTLHPIGM